MATFSWRLDCEGFIHHKMEAHHTEFFSQAPVSNVAATLATHLVRKGEMDAAIGAGGGATTLGQLTDVTLSGSIDDGSLLIYDSDAGEWVDGYAAVKAPVHNDTLSQIDKGTPVYIAGTHTSGKPTVEPADNNGAGTHPAIGLAFEDIAAGTEGRVIVSGMLHGVDTTAYSAGDALYLGSTPGSLTATRPSLSADQVQKVGIVTRVNVAAGDILVIGAGRVNDVNNELITLTGVARQADDLGTFTGTTISDANTIKGALQELETDVEGRASLAGNNAFTGTNSFSSLPTSGTVGSPTLPTLANELVTKFFSDSQDLVVYNACAKLALANTLSGTNTFTGTTTFNTSLPTSTVTPSNATDLTTKTYVDTEIAAIGGISDGDKGDITVSGSGSVWTIDSGVVSNSKMASMADDTIKGNVSGASAAPSDLSAAQVRTMINVEDGATADQTNAEIETAYNAQVDQVTGAEITAGTDTTVHRYSPADIASFVDQHEEVKLAANNTFTGTNTFTATQTIQVDSTANDTLLLESSENTSDAAPILTLNRNSASPADGDYLGQIKFKGDSDTGVERTYAKITGKTADVSNGAENGLIEFMCKENGANTIVARLTHNAFKLINTTDLEVDGNITVTGTVDGRDVASDGTKLDFLTVTQAVDLDTLESDVATNNAKVGVTDGDKGDITVSSSGTLWNIDSGVVSNSKLADVGNNTIKGNVSGVSAAPSDLTATQVRTMINVEDGATADQTNAEIETAYNAQVAQVSGAEITAGTATGIRRYSPADIVNFVSTHETAAPVDSVNTQTGAVVLDADDIDDTSTAHKFVAAADITKLGFISVTQAVNLDTMESDIATNNAKVGVTDGDKGDIVVATSGTQWTIDTGAVSNSKLEDVDNNTIKGNVSGGISSPSDLTAAQVRTMINVEDGSTADQTDAEIETAYNNQVAQASGAEITAGTETGIRRYSPADIASFVDQHEEVKLAANNAFTGTNTFNTALPTSSVTPTAASQLITKTYSDSQDLVILGLSATKAGTNAFVGTNTFNNNLPTSTQTPTSDTQLTTKVYVDDQIDTTVLAPVSLRGTGGSPYSTQSTTTLTEQFSFDIPANTLTTRTMHLRIMGTFTTPVANAISVFSFKIDGTQYHGSQSTITTSIERPFVLELDLASMGSSTLFMVGSSRLSGSGVASGTGQPRGNAFALGGDGAFGNYSIAEDATTTLTFSMDQRWTDVTNSPVFKLFAVTAEYV